MKTGDTDQQPPSSSGFERGQQAPSVIAEHGFKPERPTATRHQRPGGQCQELAASQGRPPPPNPAGGRWDQRWPSNRCCFRQKAGRGVSSSGTSQQARQAFWDFARQAGWAWQQGVAQTAAAKGSQPDSPDKLSKSERQARRYAQHLGWRRAQARDDSRQSRISYPRRHSSR